MPLTKGMDQDECLAAFAAVKQRCSALESQLRASGKTPLAAPAAETFEYHGRQVEDHVAGLENFERHETLLRAQLAMPSPVATPAPAKSLAPAAPSTPPTAGAVVPGAKAPAPISSQAEPSAPLTLTQRCQQARGLPVTPSAITPRNLTAACIEANAARKKSLDDEWRSRQAASK